MDINPPAKEVSLDLARELLIAISQSVPDNNNLLLDSKSGKGLPNGHCTNGVAMMNGDNAEALRSELISISDVLSPEKIELPAI